MERRRLGEMGRGTGRDGHDGGVSGAGTGGRERGHLHTSAQTLRMSSEETADDTAVAPGDAAVEPYLCAKGSHRGLYHTSQRVHMAIIT